MTAPRGLRADARRNRERVLEAAESVFGEQGASASTEEVARRAGVGIGTVFRHFPTKEALYEAIVVRRLTRLVAEAPAGSDDPRVAFEAFFTRLVEEAAAKKAFADTMAVLSLDVKATAPAVGEEIRRMIGALLEAAQTAGALREDVALPEIMVLLAGACLAAEHTPDPALRKKSLALLFDGLRAGQ
ncbi:MAG: TetR family transcriptional regulator [Actinophytocola sp.]|uniref:TetR/AcrR family transcriptional regulator n=1 Tax=Actinophytocola sp. TaxID=1872138 RepID=UPI001321E828|nr:TetR/AcrR family transcriptional regulator [Actinophytocola sp.]MPZ81640.1 TetR family transcriptional regulator [Actinophytocola sp.]